MNLSRSDRSNIILGGLIALVIFLSAISPAHCQSSPLPSWNDGTSKQAIQPGVWTLPDIEETK